MRTSTLFVLSLALLSALDLPAQGRGRRGRRGEDLVDELAAYTGGWPRRVGRRLFALDRPGAVLWMKTAGELFAWIDWQYGIAGGRGYDWCSSTDTLSMETFVAACRKHCAPWEQVELYPHEPAIPGHYYHHPEVSDGDGRHLDDIVMGDDDRTPGPERDRGQTAVGAHRRHRLIEGVGLVEGDELVGVAEEQVHLVGDEGAEIVAVPVHAE